MSNDSIVAVITKISNGRNGPFAIAVPEQDCSMGSLTFSLNKPCWNESTLPEAGIYVVLSSLTKKSAGWRADQGRFFKPSDEQKKN